MSFNQSSPIAKMGSQNPQGALAAAPKRTLKATAQIKPIEEPFTRTCKSALELIKTRKAPTCAVAAAKCKARPDTVGARSAAQGDR